MPSNFINPFDFEKIFVEYFIGDGNLFALFFILLYSFAAAKFNFSNRLYFFFLVIGSVIFSIYVGEELYAIILIIFGGFAFKIIARFID
jgi:hypothetical protein